MDLRITLNDKNAIAPTRAHQFDAGLDLYTPEDVRVPPFGSETINIKVSVQIPNGYAGFIMGRSGLNIKNDIVPCNTGVIDSGYTGDICVKLYNQSSSWHKFLKGDRVAQLIIQRVELPDLIIVDKLDDRERGNNGFGSTGK